jgi:hypothetical protein
MKRRIRAATVGVTLTLAVLAFCLLLLTASLDDSTAARAAAPQQPELPVPDSESEADYVGLTKCAACHFAQYKDWKPSAHGRAHEILPAKYKKDEKCLECHATGVGHPASSDEAAATNLQGVSCEACHGPGGRHARYALTFVGQGRELTDESLKVLRSMIERMSMEQCIRCHVTKAHKPHPEFDRGTASAPATESGRRKSFFQVHQ